MKRIKEASVRLAYGRAGEEERSFRMERCVVDPRGVRANGAQHGLHLLRAPPERTLDIVDADGAILCPTRCQGALGRKCR
jgi:hypothetical protein